MKNILIIGVGILTCQSVIAKNDNPNVIIILTDDLGYGDLGCYGQTKIDTPNIDALARQGMRFTQFYSGSPVSAPSRCSLLTGKHSGHTYIRGNDEMSERGDVWSHQAMLENPLLEGQRPIPPSTFIIPHMFKQNDYTTGCIGKWGLGYPGSESTPNRMGFDFFYGYNCQRQAHTYYPPFLYRNEKREYLNNKNIIQPGTKIEHSKDIYDIYSYEKYIQNDYSPDLMFDEILSFITKNKDDNFFLMWATPIPHVPLQAPRKWIDYYVNKFGEEEPYLGDLGYYPTRFPRATYAAMISYLDEQVGCLVEYLKENNLYDNTLIIFTSDNGPTFNGGSDSPWFNSAGLFRSDRGWGKASLHEGGIRVPLIATWPDRIEPGRISNHISAAWDIMPTLAEVLEIEVFSDGLSFLPELIGENQNQSHAYLYWEYPENGGSIAIRMQNWKGIIENINQGDSRMQLFDIEKDPSEFNDLANQFPGIVTLLHEYINISRIKPQVEKFNFIFDRN